MRIQNQPDLLFIHSGVILESHKVRKSFFMWTKFCKGLSHSQKTFAKLRKTFLPPRPAQASKRGGGARPKIQKTLVNRWNWVFQSLFTLFTPFHPLLPFLLGFVHLEAYGWDLYVAIDIEAIVF